MGAISRQSGPSESFSGGQGEGWFCDCTAEVLMEEEEVNSNTRNHR